MDTSDTVVSAFINNEDFSTGSSTAPLGEIDALINNISEDDFNKWFLSSDIVGDAPNLNIDQLPLFDTQLPVDSFSQSTELPDLSAIHLDYDNTSTLVPVKPDPDALPKSSSARKTDDGKKRKTTQGKSAQKLSKKPRVTSSPPPLVVKQETKKTTAPTALPTPTSIYISNKSVVVDEKYKKRLEANKKSAQASRERKKMLKCTLEEQLSQLSLENTDLATQITELETENKVLKDEFQHLQQLISESPVLSKVVARANIPFLPSSMSSPATPSTPSLPSTPISVSTPAPTTPTLATASPSTPATVPASTQQAQINNNTITDDVSCNKPIGDDDASCSNNTNSTTQAAASMYLMVVLYTFSQYFSAKLPGAALSKQPISQFSTPVVM